MNNDTPEKCGDIIDRFPCKRCGAKVPIECPDFERNRPATNNDTPADAITVIQADRDLVYSLFWFGAKTELEKRALEYIRDGKGDDARAVQEVARHRTTSLAAQDGLVERIVRDVAELPDRTSPEDWPDAMLVTADELAAIVEAALAVLEPTL